jgi:hypothetical protein
MWHAQVHAIVFYIAWKVCVVILSVQDFHNVFGGVTCTCWLLELSLSTLEMLGLSCRLLIFLMGRRISSMVMVLLLKSNTAPISCKVCLPMIRSYNGGGPPLGYSTISGRRCTFLLAEYSTKESLTSPTFLVLKVPLEVLHDFGAALLTKGMYLVDPFSKKRRSPLDPVTRRTLIVLCLTTSLLLVSSGGSWVPVRCFLDQFRPNCFDLESNLVFLALTLALALIKLAGIPGDPYSKKSPLPSIGNFPHLADSPKLSSYRVLGQSRI